MTQQVVKQTLAALGLLCTLTAGAQQVSAPDAAARVTVQGLKDPSKWFKAESQHFVVYADTSQRSVVALLNNMERLDYLLRVYTESYFKDQAYAPKLTLYYHNKVGALNDHGIKAPPDAVGLYNSCSAGVQAAGVELTPVIQVDNARLVKATDNDTLSSLFEAYARHFLYRHTDVRAPLSFVEGFAQYFANTRFSDNQLVLGKSPTGVGRYLNFLSEGNAHNLSYAEVLDDVDSRSYGRASAAALKLEFQARSWLLTHYMLSTEENRARLARYLNLANRDTPGSEAFETAYGIKPSAVGDILWRYSHSGARIVQVQADALPVASISFSGLPDAVSDYVMIDATLKSCPARATGEALLRRMTSTPGAVPNHPLARLALSRAQIDWGNPQDAIAYLSKAGGGKRNAEATYLLGLAHLRIASRQQGAEKAASVERARKVLVDAVNANPSSPEAAYALLRADIDFGDGPTATALKAVELAWDNGHEVNEYARSAALMFAYAGNHAKSRQALSVLAHSRRDPAMVSWANEWQARLLAGVDSSEVLAELRRPPTAEAAAREWTIAGDSVMQSVVASAGAENARRYLQGLAPNPATPETAIDNIPLGR